MRFYDRKNGLGVTCEGKRQMAIFRDAANSVQLFDLGFVGEEYTWGQNSENNVKCRLDRGFATQEWHDIYPYSWGVYLNPSKLDHLLVLVEVRVSNLVAPRKPKIFALRKYGCTRRDVNMWSMRVGTVSFKGLNYSNYVPRLRLLGWHLWIRIGVHLRI